MFCLGILGTTASTIYEVNLILQLVLIVFLAIGYYQKRPSKRHGTIMALATLLNLGAVFLIMLPSFIINFDAIVANPFSPGVSITIIHSVVGSVTLALGALFSLRFLIAIRNSKPLKCGTRRLMISTLLLWIIALVGGLSFFLYYYL